MNDKSKTTLECGTANSIRSRYLWGLISHPSCALMQYKQSPSDTMHTLTHSTSNLFVTCWIFKDKNVSGGIFF